MKKLVVSLMVATFALVGSANSFASATASQEIMDAYYDGSIDSASAQDLLQAVSDTPVEAGAFILWLLKTATIKGAKLGMNTIKCVLYGGADMTALAACNAAAPFRGGDALSACYQKILSDATKSSCAGVEPSAPAAQ